MRKLTGNRHGFPHRFSFYIGGNCGNFSKYIGYDGSRPSLVTILIPWFGAATATVRGLMGLVWWGGLDIPDDR